LELLENNIGDDSIWIAGQNLTISYIAI